MKKRKILFSFILFFSGFIISQAQTYTLTLKLDSAISSLSFKNLTYKKIFSSSVERTKEFEKILLEFYDKGYLTASFDSLSGDSFNQIAYIKSGKKFLLASLRKGNVDDKILSEIAYRKDFNKEQTFKYKKIRKLFEKILAYCENSGYPFASVKLDTIRIFNEQIYASINLKKNKKIIIDSIINNGNAKIANVFLFSCINLKQGELYNETKIKKIDSRLKQLSFLTIREPLIIRFSETETKINLYADKRKSSQCDGIIGFMPNNGTTGKLVLSGEVHLKLQNSFDRGELVDFNWRRLQEKTQDLNLNLVYPFLFSSPFGIDYRFYLFKQDTSYFTLRNNLGIQYLFSAKNYLKAFVEQMSSSLIKNKSLETITALPPYADVNTTLYGLELKEEKLDYLFNPRKGYQLKLIGSAGNKTIKKNSQIKSTAYDSISLRTTQYRMESNIGLFIPFFKHSTFWVYNRTAFISHSGLFENELFRIGGLKTLRGFDEESIHASFYNILIIEYRYIFEKNSYLNLFWNGCYYEKLTNNGRIFDTPYGFGVGITFETKAGIFSLNYALGKQFNEPINFKSGKIHFGIISYF